MDARSSATLALPNYRYVTFGGLGRMLRSLRFQDVSTVKELCRRWYPEVLEKRADVVSKESKHRYDLMPMSTMLSGSQRV